MGNNRILIVEDEVIIFMHLRILLEEIDYVIVDKCISGEEAIDYLRENPNTIDCVFMDIQLSGDMDGVDTVNVINNDENIENIPIVYLTSNIDDVTYERAKLANPLLFLKKPFDSIQLATTLKMALNK